MKKYLLVLFCLYSVRLLGQSLEADRLALVAVYNQGNGPSWLANWVVPGSPGDSPCGWTGVTCEGGRVTRLDLKGIGIYGTLAPEIGNLTSLTYLDLTGAGLWYGALTGNLPASIANLTNLEYLNLTGHTFNIASVGVVGNMTALKSVAITPTGEVPAGFANLVNLETLYLGTEDPMGGGVNYSFPSFLSGLPKLKELHLHGPVNGELPAALASFTNLEVLDLRVNGFPNHLPLASGQLPKLRKLYISRYGGIADFSFLSSLTNLEELELYDSSFGAMLPVSVGNLTKLNKIIINSSSFHGPLPADIGSLPGLTLLNLKSNSLSGPVPDLSNIPVSGYVDLSDNAFTFEGIESNVGRLDQYSPQATISINPQIVTGSALLLVNAGGTQANNTYTWYRDNVLFATNAGNNALLVTDDATYRVEVTNSEAPALKLVSSNFRNRAMPVTLVSFNAALANNKTRLTWKTTEEVNNKGFEIERSANGRTFEMIGFVDGNGHTKESRNYHFTDMTPLPVAYYRLKQLDHDGKFEYSKVVAVQAPQRPVGIYPNPAQQVLTVSGAEPGMPVSVYTHTGTPVMTNARLSNGELDVKGLQEGIYTIHIGDVAKKLLIQR